MIKSNYIDNSLVDNAEFAAGVKQSAKISFDDDIAPTRSRLKAISNVEKNNVINSITIEDRPEQDSNIKIEGKRFRPKNKPI